MFSLSQDMAASDGRAHESEVTRAQKELRYAYRAASVGQMYAGVVWLTAAVAWLTNGSTSGIIVLVIGGSLIYPVTTLVSRLLGNPGTVASTNPLKEASVAIPLVGPLGVPLAAAAALYDVAWFFPAFMVLMGAHYLPFAHLYGMRVFIPLGAGMWLAGLAIGMWAPGTAVLGAFLTGAALLAVGVKAAADYRREFAA
ncbi:MAG TPA: hypothetical protein VJQ79_03225 [Acidimicrobiia bacterium]|nr:hypothetical protein [Acidimicrobiia bacterium]